MAAQLPAKSILKQPSSQPTEAEEREAKIERDRRNLGIALHHANRIQHQKDVEARIFANVETLLEFPPATPFSPSDATRFPQLIRPFQPSDYDNLIEERRIDGKCGYALCSNKPRSVTVGSSAAWKFGNKGAGDFCSNTCVEKALYVKTQLSEVPAWEREPGYSPKIVLHADDRRSNHSSFIAPTVERNSNHHELAAERGESTSSIRPGHVMAANIVEKPHSTSIRESEQVKAQSHTAIEGHEPTFSLNEQAEPIRSHPSTVEDANATVQQPEHQNKDNEAWKELYDHLTSR